MSKGFRFKRVRSWLVFWFLLVALTPLFIVTIISYFQQVQSIREEGIAKLTAIRDLKVRELNGWFFERQADLQVAAGDEEIIEAALHLHWKESSPENIRKIGIARELLDRLIYTYEAYDELFIICAETGKIEYSTDKSREGLDKSKDTYFTEPMRTGKVFIKDIYYSRTLKKPSMTFSMPVFDPSDESRIVAILVGRMDLKHSLYDLLLNRNGMGETGETLVVNKDVFALNELRWYDRAPLTLEIKAKPAVQASKGNTGIAETKDYRGEMVLAAYTHIPKMGWGFIAKQDLSEVYASAGELLRNILILLSGSVVAIVAIAFSLARTLVAPIQKMSAVSTKLQGGDLSARNEVEREDELGFLAKSINDMADSLVLQMSIQRGSAELATTMVASTEMDGFAHDLLKKLIEITDSRLGAFYKRSKDSQTFEPFASIGADADLLKSFDARNLEGEFGMAVTTGKIAHISDIPENTRFMFKAVAGDALPKEIITIPLVTEGQVAAIISLASLKGYARENFDVLEQTQIGINTALSNLMADERTRELAEELTIQNEELQAQSEELQSQTVEMRAQADQLEAQQARIQEADKSEFLSNMSHDLRTPLNSVMALSQLMLSKGTGKEPEKEAEYLRVIERNGRHLLNLINDVLDISKIESGHVDFVLTDFDPSLTLQRVIESIHPLADKKGLSLKLSKENVPFMHSDEDRVRQILFNLLSNAVKFTDEGEIEISIAASQEKISFVVRDTGIGISEADLSYIFDEFRQADGSATRRHEGTGLGLTICHKTAKLLGGDITVQSAQGKGSAFTLILPLRCPEMISRLSLAPKADEEKPAQLDKQVQMRRAHGKPHVLLVEDNEIAVLQIRSALEESGCEVAVANDGAKALESLKERIPDAIILDLMMPKIDGFQVLDQIRSTLQTATLPVLVLTAKELTSEDRARLKHNNIQQLIQKGALDRDELIALVNSLFEAPPAPAPTEAAPAGPDRHEGSQVRGKTILVVEDNRDNMLAITAILDGIGCECITAEDGHQAIEAAKKSPPALILMDIHMPRMSGLEATRQIKADPDTADIPIIALTAKAMKGDREDILVAGCDEYLSKPIKPQKLIETVQKWIG